RGDCEDYAIAKFVALREAGVADEDLRLLVVRDASLDEYHAVVAARSEDRWLILDNRRMTLMDTVYSSYSPLFALRHEEQAAVVAASSAAGKADVVTSANAAPGPSGINMAPLLL
ncbi:MAG: transglutaminase-like cysteine peptidase, partial [Pseudorhodoplanes sp.]